ncbi:type 1 glutamine amidotransferase [Phycisphaerales bacterium AB-hyl4]|uniref:Type 1 glutamine amidotransferase n=1 Tax=Natronomicrosphaera hydrolytica TaxID=3242702 RepID=A0ABV4U6U9_9BACT
MAILVFQHNSHETPARLGDILRDNGHRLRVFRLNEGDSLPPDLDDVDGIISLGGPMNVDEADEHKWINDELAYLKQAIDADLPVVGICLGAQLIAAAMGGKVEAMPAAELGWHNVKLAFPGTIDPMMAGLPWTHMQFHLHGQEVTELPPDATPLAASKVCKNQAFKVGLRAFGFQYHFEWDKQQLHAALDGHQAWIGEAEGDVEAIRTEIDTYYEMYRHLGDRLSANLATLLFPLDKRLGGSRDAPKTWDATEST